MSDVLGKCTVCRALLDEEDLFCANCGTEAPQRGDSGQLQTTTWRHNFECRGCGASMSYDASAQTLRCPFCGSQDLGSEQQEARVLAPQRVVPFVVSRETAASALRQWLGRGFWRPGDLSTAAAITKITPVFVPFWVFAARTLTYWTADSSQKPWGARGDWYPLSGRHQGQYSGLLIGASGVLTPSETSAVGPFDLAAGVDPDQVDLENHVVEQFRVQRKYARPLARQGLHSQELEACRAYVPGRCRNLKVNLRIEGLASEPVLLPVWVMAYRYQDRVFRFLLNGQTGKATGQAPTSWKKVAAAIAIALGAGLLLLILLGLFSAVFA